MKIAGLAVCALLLVSVGPVFAATPLGVVVVDEHALDEIDVDGRTAWSHDAAGDLHTKIETKVDRRSRAVHHQAVVTVEYIDTDWRDIHSVEVGGAHQALSDPPSHDVVDCGENGQSTLCRYSETVTFDVSDAVLRRDLASGVSLTLTTKHGEAFKAILSPDQVERQFQALDDYVHGAHVYPARNDLIAPLPLGLVFAPMAAADLQANYRLDHGVPVAKVLEDSAAAATNIKPEDVILAVNGKPVSGQADIDAALAAVKPGGTATVTVWHDADTIDVTLNF